MAKHGHTTRVRLDFSAQHGEEIMEWLDKNKLTRPCPHEDHDPHEGGLLPTQLGAEVFIMLAGMVSTEMLSNIMAERIAEEAGFI